MTCVLQLASQCSRHHCVATGLQVAGKIASSGVTASLGRHVTLTRMSLSSHQHAARSVYFMDLQSTHFTHERSTSNIHRLVHSSISFFEKFSDSLKLGFYIRNNILVIGNFFCNIIIIIQTFRTELKSYFFLAQFSGMSRVILFSSPAQRMTRTY